jgi:hypothetical protein
VHKNFRELLAALNAHKVKYLIVGGYAVSLHAQPRLTKALDLFVKADLHNAEAIMAALKDFGAPVDQLTIADFTDTGCFVRFGHPPEMVDIMPAILGVEFAKAWKKKVTTYIDKDGDVSATYISKSDLIAAKLAAGRPQDLADVAAIKEADAANLRANRKSKPRKTTRNTK